LPSKRPRVRHHTSEAKLDQIKAENAIHAGRTSVMTGRPCVHVELEPFGSTKPTPEKGYVPGSPRADFGTLEDGAFVEFDAPVHLRLVVVPVGRIGPRNTGEILTEEPLSLAGLNPVFVKVRRKWYQWWRPKPE